MEKGIKYTCLKKNYYSSNGYTIIPIRKTDMELVRKWRNQQVRVLRQTSKLSRNDQDNYYKDKIEPLFNQNTPSQILVSYLNSDLLIGYGGLVHIDWHSKIAEISFLLNTNRINKDDLYRKEFSLFLDLIKQVAFQDMGFHKLFSETYDIRPLHTKVLEDNGFKLEGRLKEHILVDGIYVDLLISGIIKK